MPSARSTTTPAPLTDEQRRLVRENVGLVGVHLRTRVRHLINHSHPWEDLFQEGCLGLIRAAITHRNRPDIPFAAYALRRIHNAVSRALKSKSAVGVSRPISTVPMFIGMRERAPIRAANASERTTTDTVPYNVTFRLDKTRSDDRSDGDTRIRRRERRNNPYEPPDTVGDRLRSKYEQAVRQARETMTRKNSPRGDRAQLVRLLEQERLLIPDEEARRPLRQIARDTGSSYGRVSECEQQFTDLVRRSLEGDPEFAVLRRYAKTHPFGTAQNIDVGMEHELADASASEFLRRLRKAGPDERGRMWNVLLELTRGELEAMIRDRLAELPASERERLFSRY